MSNFYVTEAKNLAAVHEEPDLYKDLLNLSSFYHEIKLDNIFSYSSIDYLYHIYSDTDDMRQIPLVLDNELMQYRACYDSSDYVGFTKCNLKNPESYYGFNVDGRVVHLWILKKHIAELLGYYKRQKNGDELLDAENDTIKKHQDLLKIYTKGAVE